MDDELNFYKPLTERLNIAIEEYDKQLTYYKSLSERQHE